jgi:hypothetical protein
VETQCDVNHRPGVSASQPAASGLLPTVRFSPAIIVEFTAAANILYDGPIYARMRSFCAEHIGRLYTLRKILTFWNGSLPNAFLTCGGWGCSHNWTETDAYRWPHVTVDSGEFANDGYREQVEAVQAMAAQRPVKCPGPHGWREAEGPGPVGASVGTDR